MLSPQDQAEISLIRQKQADGTATMEDLRSFVKILRQGRLSALASSEGAKKKAVKAAIPNADDLLSELMK